MKAWICSTEGGWNWSASPCERVVVVVVCCDFNVIISCTPSNSSFPGKRTLSVNRSINRAKNNNKQQNNKTTKQQQLTSGTVDDLFKLFVAKVHPSLRQDASQGRVCRVLESGWTWSVNRSINRANKQQNNNKTTTTTHQWHCWRPVQILRR